MLEELTFKNMNLGVTVKIREHVVICNKINSLCAVYTDQNKGYLHLKIA